MIHHFQSSITATKDEAVRPPKGFRFGNFDGVRTLPSVGKAHVAGQHVKSYFNNKQIFFTICDWFETWMPWQKRIVLCGTTDRCSNRQLECLATALEPVFHRDFITALKGHYPRRPLKKPKQEDHHEALVRALQMATEGTDLDPRSRLLAKKKQETKEMEEFALNFVKEVLEVAFERYVAIKDSHESLTDEIEDELPYDTSSSSSLNERNRRVQFREGDHEEVTSDESQGNTPKPHNYREEIVKKTPTESNLNGHIEKDEEVTSSLAQVSVNEEDSLSPTGCDQSKTLENTSSKQEGCGDGDDEDDDETKYASTDANTEFNSQQPVQRLNRDRYTNLAEQQVAGFDIAPTYSKLPPLEAKKASTLSWCMNRQMSASLPSTPVSGTSAKASHRHHSNVSSVDITSASDFFHKQKVSRLGSMHGALRTGHIKKPNQVQDIYVPVQKAFKNAKWWNGGNNRTQISRSKTISKPNKTNLKEHFKEQVKQIWQWLSEWEDHEKGDLLVELIKLCDQDLIKFFAQCLVQRLQDRSDINSLPDKLLFYIFTFLPVDDISIAEKVCRRWHYITAQDELWRIKCEELGMKESIPNLVEMVEDFMRDNSVDWREAYEELSNIVLNARVTGQGRRQGWLRGPSRQCHLLNINFDDLLKRTPLPMESLQNIPIDNESSSEEYLYEHHRSSTVVDLPIHFMQTAVHEGEDSPLSSRNTDTEGATPDMQGYRGRDRGSSLQKSRNEGDQTRPPTQDKGRGVSREGAPKPKKLQKKLAKAGQEDFALDIRPDPIQAKDVLEKPSSDKKEEGEEELEDGEGMSQRKVVVNPVKRVRRLQGHMDAVYCLMFDTRRIVTGSMDRSIRVWDIRSGRSISKIYGHKGGIRCIQFDEDRIISGSWDTTIMVWDIIRFDCLAVLTGHSDVVSCLKFDHTHLVTGSNDKTIRVWSLCDYQCVRIIECHSEEVTCLLFDGVHITSGSADKSIKVSNIHTGDCILHISGLPEPVTALDIQGELILSGTIGGKLFFWNRETGEAEAAVQPHDTRIFNITFLPQSQGGARFLTGAGDGTIKEWDLYSMTCVRALHGHRGPVRDVQATQDRVVSCSDDGNVRIWDLYTPSLKPGTKAAEDTIETRTINQRKDK